MKENTTELVEITIKIPKVLLDLLQAENYLSFDPTYFYEAAVRSMISCAEGTLNTEDLAKFYEKYGRDISVIYVPERYW